MPSSPKPHAIDRVVDALIDRNHPFWNDERQSAIYNEAAAAALALQGFLIVLVGGIGLLIVGRPAIGIVTAMVLTVTAGQMLVVGVLVRRHVEFDARTWSRQASPARKGVAALLFAFYVACYLWARFHSGERGHLDGSTVAGLVTGAAFAVGLMALAAALSRRAIRKRDTQDVGE